MTQATAPDERTRSRPEPPVWGQALRSLMPRAFRWVGHTALDVRIRGVEHFSNRPATLIVVNHKSNFDIVLLVPTLYLPWRGQGPMGRCAFVAGEHLFLPGYISEDLLAAPEPLRRLLYPVSVGPVLHGMGAYPVRQSDERQLVAHLRTIRALAGDVPLDRVFHEPPQAYLPGVPPGARVSDVLRARYHDALRTHYTFAIFQPWLRSELRREHVRAIRTCLDRYASILNAGDALALAPEGTFEREGKFEQIKAGLGRVVDRVAREMTVLPVNITYDSMTSGRTTAFVSVGEELRGVERWPRRLLEARVDRAIRSLNTVNLSQLAARALREQAASGATEVEEAALKERIMKEAKLLAEKGEMAVDPRLLEAQSFERRWKRFLRYASRQRMLDRVPRRRLSCNPAGFTTPPTQPPFLWAYCANELDSALGRESPPAEPASMD